jgi:hypothetical protein
MEMMGRYRHELKYGIGYGQYLSLRQRLRTVMQTDSHADAGGRYRIRSIYFDNYKDKALREKTDGILKREKFRIRYYNDDFSHITLEKKQKYDHLCKKDAAVLTKAECESILSGDIAWMPDHFDPLIQEFYIKLKQQLLKPRVLVSYIREPYLYEAGNVRVTFDFDVRTSLFHSLSLKKDIPDIAAGDSPGTVILEIKYDAYLPEVISHLLQMGELRQQAFSKYAVSRKFG